jgi:hypothetical protein
LTFLASGAWAVMQTAGWPNGGGAVATCVILLAAYWTCVRLGEARVVSELTPAIAEIALGLLLGLGAFATVLAALWGLGLVEWHSPMFGDWRSRWPSRALSGLPQGLALALIGVGMVTRPAVRLFGPRVGLTVATVIAIPFLPGLDAWQPERRIGCAFGFLILSLIYLRTSRLWMPIGMAMGWSAAVSMIIGGYFLEGGYDLTDAFIWEPGRPALPGWLSGSEGPESSLPCLVGAALIAAALALGIWKSGGFGTTRAVEPT